MGHEPSIWYATFSCQPIFCTVYTDNCSANGRYDVAIKNALAAGGSVIGQ